MKTVVNLWRKQFHEHLLIIVYGDKIYEAVKQKEQRKKNTNNPNVKQKLLNRLIVFRQKRYCYGAIFISLCPSKASQSAIFATTFRMPD